MTKSKHSEDQDAIRHHLSSMAALQTIALIKLLRKPICAVFKPPMRFDYQLHAGSSGPKTGLSIKACIVWCAVVQCGVKVRGGPDPVGFLAEKIR